MDSCTDPGRQRSTPDDSALEAALAHLMAVGAQALADDAERGPAWSVFADWAHRRRLPSLPTEASVIAAWLADGSQGASSADRLEVLDAIVAVHSAAGSDDPTAALQ